MNTETNFDLNITHMRQYAIACSGIAQHYAAAGDMWQAIHAQVISYTATAEWIMKLHKIETAPIFTLIADKISYLNHEEKDTTWTVLSKITQVFATELPHQVVSDFFTATQSPHDFEVAYITTAQLHMDIIDRWLENKSPTVFISDRIVEQTKNLTRAEEYLSEQEIEKAILKMHDADVAALEAWLIENAVETGDISFANARMRWDFFVETISNLNSLPAGLQESLNLVRSRMAWVLGPINAQKFAEGIPIIQPRIND
jgi:hypothetical protein